jgi:hypothetical protein
VKTSAAIYIAYNFVVPDQKLTLCVSSFDVVFKTDFSLPRVIASVLVDILSWISVTAYIQSNQPYLSQ